MDIQENTIRSVNFGFNRNMIHTVFALALPAMIENILQVFIGIVDTYFVGRIGTEAIAGVGITNVIMNIYIAFFLAIGVGTTAFVARNVGANDFKTANESVKQSIILALVIGFLFGIINLLFSKKILQLLGAENRVINYALPYFMVVAVPSVFLCIMMVLSSALRGAGDTKTPMKVAFAANILNAILDYILIFGIFNFNGLGVLGAGLASTLARIASVVVLIYKIKNKKTKLKVKVFEKWHVNKRILKSILKIGLPAGFEKLIMRIGQLVYIGMIIKIGTESYAAHSIGGTIETFSYLPGSGFAIAASTLVGQNLGARKPDEAQKFGMLSYLLGAVFMSIVGIVYFFFGSLLASIFTQDTIVIEQVTRVLKIMAVVEPFVCITLVITAALQGAGDTKFPMYSTFVGIWLFRVFGIYILGIKLNLGLVGVWIAVALDLVIRGIVLMIRFMNGKWKQIEI